MRRSDTRPQVRMMMTPQLRMAMFFTMGRSVRERFGPSVEMPRKYAKWFTWNCYHHVCKKMGCKE